jgi:aryl-alcohol dehydrogenase-like predicted oxidoreductase
MRYQRFGKSDMEVSVVCPGNWASGEKRWGGVEEDEAIRATRLAADLGINFFDTAKSYGWGASERLLGKSLAGVRQNVYITTKMGRKPRSDGKPGMGPVDLSPELYGDAIDESLRNLQTDYVDLFMAHAYDGTTPLHDMAGGFERLREQGKIRWWGISNFDAAAVRELAQYPGFAGYQGLLNLVEQDALNDIIPACNESGVGFMGFTPLGMGLLTGKYAELPAFAANDVRTGRYYFTTQGFAAAQPGLEVMRRMAETKGATLAQLASAWVFAAGATVTVVGFKSESQVRDNAAASDVTLSEAEVRELTQAFQGTSASEDRYGARGK